MEQVLDPYRMMFKKIKGETAAPHHTVTAKIIKSLKNAKTFFGFVFEGAQLCMDFYFLLGVLETNPREKWGLIVLTRKLQQDHREIL